MSELVTNLQTIYNTKLAIKAAIGTESDIFEDYPAYIAAMDGGITPEGTSYITTNGEHDVTSYAYAYVSVEGEIPAGYTYVSGTINIYDNGTVDVSSYASAYVNIEGGESSGGGDPYNDSYNISDVVENDLVGETVEYYLSVLSDYYTATLTSEEGVSPEEYTLEWEEYQNVDGNDVTVHVIANANYDPLYNITNDYSYSFSYLYGNGDPGIIYPILENAIVTEVTDAYYTYLVEGDLKYFNLQDLGDSVLEISENGFYTVEGQTAVNVDIADIYYPTKDQYYVITELDNAIPSTPSQKLLSISDLLDYTDLLYFNIAPVNYNDPMTGESSLNGYWEMYFTYNGNIVQGSSCNGTFRDDDDNYWVSLDITSQNAPDGITGEFMIWESDLDPETGMDMGQYVVQETCTASISETIGHNGDIYWIYIDNYYWHLISDGEAIEHLEPMIAP